jgi:hypothetical protein
LFADPAFPACNANAGQLDGKMSTGVSRVGGSTVADTTGKSQLLIVTVAVPPLHSEPNMHRATTRLIRSANRKQDVMRDLMDTTNNAGEENNIPSARLNDYFW